MNASQFKLIPKDRILFVVAMEEEASGFLEGYNTIYTGVGKVKASYQLTKSIGLHRPEIIINLGSAGSALFSRETLVSCSQFVQRDMDGVGLGFEKYQTPFCNTPRILNTGCHWDGLENGVCGTGDQFVTAHFEDLFTVIDMEAYALAYISMEEKIPFYCIKFISDGADGSAANDWSELVHKAGEKFKSLLEL